MPKIPKFPLIATAATKTVVDSPLFTHILDHWGEIAGRVVIVIPENVVPPPHRKVRFKQVSRSVPMLGDVISEVIKASDYTTKVAAIVDPFVAFKWDIFGIFPIAEQRQLSLSWCAAAHAVRLIDFDTPNGMDESVLSFFCATETIWQFMAARELPEHVPFISPAWNGWLATWMTKHVHEHKYHDVTDLRAVGRFEDAPTETVGTEGLGPLTFNAPKKNHIHRADRR